LASSSRATSACRASWADWITGGSSGLRPSQARLFQDLVDRGLGAAGLVGVLDAQQVGTAMPAGEELVEQRRARAPDMQDSRSGEGAKRVRTVIGLSQINFGACSRD
jgi:hypothetical protein